MNCFRPLKRPWHVIVLVSFLLLAGQTYGQKHSMPGRHSPAPAPPTPAPAASASDATASPATAVPADPLGRSTPYGCVFGFLQAVNDNNLVLATQYLDTKLPQSRVEQLALQLKAVLDAGLSSSIDNLSRSEQGNIRDDLRTTREKIGVAKTPAGDIDIYLDHVRHNQEPAVWLFSSDTLAKIPAVYSQLHTPQFARFLPPFLSKTSFLGLPLWRWLAILLSIVLALLLSSVVSRILLRTARFFFGREKKGDRAEALGEMRPPVRIILLSLALWGSQALSLSVLARHYWTVAARTFAVIGIAWFLVRLSGLVASASMRRSIRAGVQERVAVITLIQRLLKLLISFIALLILLRSAGVNVSALLAGLGIGGIALALAAQETLEDLFGGIAIIMRETIRVGDYCSIADQIGTVEDIGLSSTRLRTLDRTVVSIPNAKIAKTSSENFALRDKFWLHHILSLGYAGSPPQFERLLSDINTILKSAQDVDPTTARATLIGVRDGALQLEIFAYLHTDTYNSFLVRQEQLLLNILAAVDSAGAHLAIPGVNVSLERAINAAAQRNVPGPKTPGN